MKRPLPTRRAFSASSMTSSVVVHAALLAGVVALGAWATKSEAPKRVYRLEFERGATPIANLDDQGEELGELEVEAHGDLDAELIADQVQVDFGGLAPDDREVVHEDTEFVWNDSSEIVFGIARDTVTASPPDEVEDKPVDAEEPSPALPDELPPEPEPEADRSEPSTAIPGRVEGRDPEYPKASLRLGEQGDVVLRLAVDGEGRVTLVELATSSGSRRLDQAAMSAAPTWRFEVLGDGAAASFEHTVHFRLQR